MSPAPAPAGVAARPRVRLIDLIALVLVAGAALAVARGVRDATRGPKGEETVLVPTLVALGFWLGVVLVEGLAARLRGRVVTPGTGWRAVAWRLVALVLLAACLLAQVSLLRRYQNDASRNLARLEVELAERWGRGSPTYQSSLDYLRRRAHSWNFYLNTLTLSVIGSVGLGGLAVALLPPRGRSRIRSAEPAGRPAWAGWLYAALMIGVPLAIALAVERYGPESWVEGLEGGRHWTWRGRTVPALVAGILAWLGAAEWNVRGLKSARRPRTRLSTAYRLLTLGAATTAAMALGTIVPFDIPGRGPRSWDHPLGALKIAWFGLTAAVLAAGLAARAAVPAEPWPAPKVLRTSKRLLVAIAALAALVLALTAWEDEMETIAHFWPSLWRSKAFGRVTMVLGQLVHGAFRTCLWGAALAYLSSGVVALLAPRRSPHDAGRPSRLVDLIPWAWRCCGPVVVAMVVAPYLVEALQFDDRLRGGLSLIGDLIDRLNTAAGTFLAAIDVELVFLAPGAYWILSRHLDGFAPPDPSPLDFALVDGPTARRFATDWASLFVLLATAPPIAFAGFVILLG